ncbi:methyl-CpG-binding domain protein 1 isoform X42 [Macaca thibetana thibetana]|uniref:methyl-CpG-binding domain protein 1 isoform X42 n=1 Tax=Macaca thibetana thibetana TaxID=257877 RepID=UPI0021BC8326|nr:methyl-CpG-binding domain protein 1 isoform X42 [Macaca thibetana thibetana]
MAEDWLDCPALGPGWKRREVFRKSGATCGRSDTYYQSPTGDRIRSKVELTRYLGPACDLTLFDFKQGILCYPAPKAHPVAVASKKRKKPSKPAKTRKRQVGPQSGEVRKEAPRDETKADTDTAPASFPAPGCCENCGISFSGDGTQRQRLKTLCKDCRAQRIAFNREQRMFKSRGCGVCRGCQTQEDCGRCPICLRPPRPGLRRQWKCVQRRCLRGKHARRKGGCDSKMAARRRPGAQPLPPPSPSQSPEPTEPKRLLPSVWSESEDGAGSPPPYHRRKRPSSARRHHLGPTLKPTLATRTAQPDHTQAPTKQEAGGGFVLPPPGTDLVFLREGASSPVQVPGPVAASTEALLQEAQCSGLSWVVALPQVKQEKADTQDEWTPGTAVLTSPVLVPGCPSKAVDPGLPSVKQEPPDPEEDKEENKDDSASKLAPEEEAGGAGTPVITEIFSLGGTRFRDTAVWLPSLQGRHSGREDGCKVWETEDTVEPTSTSWNPRGWPGTHVSLSPPPASMMWVSCRRSWCPSSQS